MQSVPSGCLFDFLRSVSVSIVSWRRRAVHAQKTEVLLMWPHVKKQRRCWMWINTPPTTKPEMPMRWFGFAAGSLYVYMHAAPSTSQPLDAVYRSTLTFTTGDGSRNHHCHLYQSSGWSSSLQKRRATLHSIYLQSLTQSIAWISSLLNHSLYTCSTHTHGSPVLNIPYVSTAVGKTAFEYDADIHRITRKSSHFKCILYDSSTIPCILTMNTHVLTVNSHCVCDVSCIMLHLLCMPVLCNQGIARKENLLPTGAPWIEQRGRRRRKTERSHIFSSFLLSVQTSHHVKWAVGVFWCLQVAKLHNAKGLA